MSSSAGLIVLRRTTPRRMRCSDGTRSSELRFLSVLSQFDIFTEVVTQRSEHSTGVWLAGLDVVAMDALQLPGNFFTPPPVACLLARGIGAAIRRARTRLPGGAENPVAIVRIPRERMIGSGIASSLFHEVGHQGSALLGLRASITPVLTDMQQEAGKMSDIWRYWKRWINEILADLWAVSPARHHRDPRAGWCCQPAAILRLPSQRRRSASSAMDSGQAELRSRRGTLSRPPMEHVGENLGILLPVVVRF